MCNRDPADTLGKIPSLRGHSISNWLYRIPIVDSANCLAQFARRGRGATALGECISAVRTAAQRKQIEPQVLPDLADAAERLLKAGLDDKAWMSAAEEAIWLAARAGRHAKAEAILSQLRDRADDKMRTRLDIIEAEVRWFGGDPEGAVTLLKSRFDSEPPLENRVALAVAIVQMWPPMAHPQRKP
jgi:hypothetical protein